VQDFTVQWYNTAVESALHDFCSNIAPSYSVRKCVMGRYLMRTATFQDEVDLLIVAQSRNGLDVEKVIISELAASEDLRYLDSKEDGVRYKMKKELTFDGVKVQDQLRIRILVAPRWLYQRSFRLLLS